MSALLLTGGRILDPASHTDVSSSDLLIVDGKIVGHGAAIAGRVPADAERVPVAGRVVCPGLIDLHVHLREPGQSDQKLTGLTA